MFANDNFLWFWIFVMFISVWVDAKLISVVKHVRKPVEYEYSYIWKEIERPSAVKELDLAKELVKDGWEIVSHSFTKEGRPSSYTYTYGLSLVFRRQKKVSMFKLLMS